MYKIAILLPLIVFSLLGCGSSGNDEKVVIPETTTTVITPAVATTNSITFELKYENIDQFFVLGEKQKVKIKVIAHHNNGRSLDVTEDIEWQFNDPSYFKVNSEFELEGLAKTSGKVLSLIAYHKKSGHTDIQKIRVSATVDE